MSFRFAREEIHLGLPRDGSIIDDGCWKIEPMSSDVVGKLNLLAVSTIHNVLCHMFSDTKKVCGRAWIIQLSATGSGGDR